MRIKKIKSFISEKISKIQITKCSNNCGESQIKMDDFFNYLQIDSAILEYSKDFKKLKLQKGEIQAYLYLKSKKKKFIIMICYGKPRNQMGNLKIF